MGSLCNEPVNKIRHYVLAYSITWLGVPLEFDQCFKETLCVRYFTELISGSLGNGKAIKSRHYVLDIILGLLR